MNEFSLREGAGRLDNAVKIQKEVLERRRQTHGEEHSDTISAMRNLAITL